MHRCQVEGGEAALKAGSQALGMEAVARHYVIASHSTLLRPLNEQVVSNVVRYISRLCAAHATKGKNHVTLQHLHPHRAHEAEILHIFAFPVGFNACDTAEPDSKQRKHRQKRVRRNSLRIFGSLQRQMHTWNPTPGDDRGEL